jgi:hypothetical protein
MHWVNSILTYCEKSETKKGVLYPMILFVATHKDRVVRYSFKHGGGREDSVAETVFNQCIN